MAEDPILEMLKQRGLTDAQIAFLIKILNKVRSEMKNPDWEGAESSVKSVLEQEIKNLC